jgi:hypothetical protein
MSGWRAVIKRLPQRAAVVAAITVCIIRIAPSLYESSALHHHCVHHPHCTINQIASHTYPHRIAISKLILIAPSLCALLHHLHRTITYAPARIHHHSYHHCMHHHPHHFCMHHHPHHHHVCTIISITYAPSCASPSRMHHHLHHICTIMCITTTYAPSSASLLLYAPSLSSRMHHHVCTIIRITTACIIIRITITYAHSGAADDVTIWCIQR